MTRARIIQQLENDRNALELRSGKYVLNRVLDLLRNETHSHIHSDISLDVSDIIIYHQDTAEVHSQLNADGSTPMVDVDEMWKNVNAGLLVRHHSLTDIANRCLLVDSGPYICYKPQKQLKCRRIN